MFKLRGDVILFGSFPLLAACSLGISGNGQFKIDGFGAPAGFCAPFGILGRGPKFLGSNLPP